MGVQTSLYLEQFPLIRDTGRLFFRGITQKISGKRTKMNAALIGKTYRGKTICATPAKIALFAKAIGDENLAYYGPEPVAPPMFDIVPTMYSLFRLFSDKNLGMDFSNLMVVGQETDFFRSIRGGERIYSVSFVKDIVDKKGGQVLVVQSDGFSESGESLYKDYSSFYIREPGKSFSGMKDLRREDQLSKAPDPAQVTDLEVCAVPAGQISRYSKIAGDYNPFHYLSFISRLFGYSGKFMQGTCLTSLISRMMINGLLGGDSSRLGRISFYFREKVLEKDALKIQTWKVPEGEIPWQNADAVKMPSASLVAFQVKNQDGAVVVPKGVCLFK